jgi:Holliday junction resolvase
LPEVHWLTVETSATEGGVPDMNGCCTGIEFWIEMKVTSGWTVSLRPQQIGWLMRRCRVGGRAFIAVRRRAHKGKCRVEADELHLFSGAYANVVKDVGVRAHAIERWHGGPSQWDWHAIKRHLLSASPLG